ncbi:polysaccharide biosynthesis tyrosine autokinase, partial [Flavobacteriaceae bacterium]|nr:polysaccharide biosynthesis tyrosine autokinase [Flavobacteriaceae bacterium]
MDFNQNFSDIEVDSSVFLKDIKYYLFFWPWFVFSILIFCTGTFFYLRYATTIFKTSASLQVKDSSTDPSSFLTEGAGAMFSFDKVKIDNYIAQINSIPSINKVVKRLDLQTKVFKVGRVKQSLMFGKEIPFQIIFKNEQSPMEISLYLDSSKAVLEIEGVSTTFGPTKHFVSDDFDLIVNFDLIEDIQNYKIYRSTVDETINRFFLDTNINSGSDKGDNIDLIIKGANINLNEAILNTVIDVAQQQQIKDKQEIFALSIEFITNRLSSIKNEIDSLTLQTIGFKSDNLIFSPELQTTSALTNITNINQEEFTLSTQRALAESLKSKLKNEDDFSLLPSNIGLESANVNALVLSYNEMIIKRNNLLAGASSRNPLVVQVSDQLTELRVNIFSSIDNYISYINTSLGEYEEFSNKTNNQVSKIPQLEAVLLSFERKLQIAERLYLFLLERREEASISFESTLPNTRVINYAHTDYLPIAPKKTAVVLIAIILGFFIPFVILYLLKIIDTKIHTREDLETLMPNIGIMGEVPFLSDIKSITDSRGVFAESSRVIRSNISFKLKEGKTNVILCTSSVKGEGKTLTAFNIAASYVATGKKVLLIGADLRNPQLHALIDIDRNSNVMGLSTLISTSSTEVTKEYINTLDLFNNQLDLLLSGPIPPNPAELLNSIDFKNLLEVLKHSYDYIIIDSAPLILVSDTLPILKFADLVMYTIRSGVTDKKLIPFITGLVEDKKVNNIGVVLNAVKAGASSYYKYGYGYRYSYQYKYNYG